MEKQSTDAEEFHRNIIKTYSDMVYRLAYSMVKNHFDADDIHQEVFLRYLRKKPLFQNSEHEKAWFLRITINCCKNHWKSAWVRKITGFKEEDSSSFFEMETEEYELVETVKRLPEKYRLVIHLFYYEDLPIDVISRVTGVRPSTVRTQLTRARNMLRERLEERDVSERV